MNGSVEKLQELLRELKQKLSEIPTAKDSTKDSLEILKKDIDRALRQLEQSETGELDHESLRARLRQAVDHFEITHPTLTAVINNILNTLAGSGV
jgi:chromosome segregation ATPase